MRRVRVHAGDLSADPRSRRRRTIDPAQLALALDGDLDAVWAVSFIVTTIPYYTPGDAVEVEAWFRRRTDIEDRIREAKLGAALRHPPSGHVEINRVWMWAALLARNLSVLLQALHRPGRERARPRRPAAPPAAARARAGSCATPAG